MWRHPPVRCRVHDCELDPPVTVEAIVQRREPTGVGLAQGDARQTPLQPRLGVLAQAAADLERIVARVRLSIEQSQW